MSKCRTNPCKIYLSVFRLEAEDDCRHLVNTNDRIRFYMHSNLNWIFPLWMVISNVLPRCCARFDDVARAVCWSSSQGFSSWIACIVVLPQRLFNLSKRRKKNRSRSSIREFVLPWKNDIGSCRRSCCLSIGHNRFGCLWSLFDRTIRVCVFGEKSIYLTLHVCLIEFPSTSWTKSLKNFILTLPSRICSLPIRENVNSIFRCAATDRLKTWRTCLTHCSIWSRV